MSRKNFIFFAAAPGKAPASGRAFFGNKFIDFPCLPVLVTKRF